MLNLGVGICELKLLVPVEDTLRDTALMRPVHTHMRLISLLKWNKRGTKSILVIRGNWFEK